MSVYDKERQVRNKSLELMSKMVTIQLPLNESDAFHA